MKKNLFTIFSVILLAALLVAPAAAKNSIYNGTVQSINSWTNTIVLLTNKGETMTVLLPEGFDLSTLAEEDQVLVKGILQEDGSVTAVQVLILETEEAEDTTDTEEPEEEETQEGNKAEDSAYCNGSKDVPHPMAAALADKYGVTTDWVMGYFCNGYGMGEIMLALKTNQINGADAETLLAQRAEGQGWGNIWKELKMVGNERDVKTPPGQLKKLEHGNR
jgi:hypothetical protein